MNRPSLADTIEEMLTGKPVPFSAFRQLDPETPLTPAGKEKLLQDLDADLAALINRWEGHIGKPIKVTTISKLIGSDFARIKAIFTAEI